MGEPGRKEGAVGRSLGEQTPQAREVLGGSEQWWPGRGRRAHPTAPLHPQAGGGRRRQEARSTAQLYSAVLPSGPRGAGGGRRQDQSRQALDSLAEGRGGLRSQTPPGLLCPPRHESPTRGGNCSPAPSAVAALSAPPLLPAPAGQVRRGAVSGTGEEGCRERSCRR